MPELVDLHHEIDDLALQLVMGSGGPEGGAACLAILERILDQASRSGAVKVADAARAFIDGLKGAAGHGKETLLQEGIARLQAALERPESRPEPSSLALDPELLSDFVVESREHLSAIEAQVLILEADPLQAESLNSVFRGFHTIKGLAGFLELWDIQKLAHEVETILDRARNAQLTITPPAIDVILASADYLRRWLAHLESDLRGEASEAPPCDEALLASIRAFSTTAVVEPGSAAAPETATALAALASAVELESAAPPASPDSSVAAPAEKAPQSQRMESLAVKVDTAKLDYLVDMAGEMVIAESMVRHDPDLEAIKTPRLARNLAQLNRITSELQKTAMAMRLVPIGPLFHRMARLVRDLSRQFGKNVQMETEGDEIQLDRTIVEALADPLMHMVRNALDHGIEPPAERRDSGKTPSARLLLRAHHQAGQVVIEVSDDGRGLDRARIAAKAVEKGLISDADALSDSEVFNLIFEPGFSTAKQVTNVSGRGVGMDVVRRHIEKLRGRIEIRSVLGQSASFFLKLPLTLAIIDGLVVRVGSERYILPLFAVREMFRPSEETIWTVQNRSEMALVRDTLLPVLRLYKRFRVTPRSEDPRESVLVVAEVEGQRFCLLVDELIGKQEVVIKSLGETFKNVPSIMGGAILGDGRVCLILDLERLFKDRSSDATR